MGLAWSTRSSFLHRFDPSTGESARLRQARVAEVLLSMGDHVRQLPTRDRVHQRVGSPAPSGGHTAGSVALHSPLTVQAPGCFPVAQRPSGCGSQRMMHGSPQCLPPHPSSLLVPPVGDFPGSSSDSSIWSFGMSLPGRPGGALGVGAGDGGGGGSTTVTSAVGAGSGGAGSSLLFFGGSGHHTITSVMTKRPIPLTTATTAAEGRFMQRLVSENESPIASAPSHRAQSLVRT
jgi:hypothetical protein